MFGLSASNRLLLYSQPTDMRKSFDGLCGLVTGKLGGNPQSGEVFIFINKRRDKIKLLHWEPGGFVLYYKRLEEGTFLPPRFEGTGYRMDWAELAMMITGLTATEIHLRKRYNPHSSCG